MLACSLLLGQLPAVHADDRVAERRFYLRQRALIVRQMRAAERGSDQYLYLRRKYRDIVNTIKNLTIAPTTPAPASASASTQAMTVTPIAVSSSDPVEEKQQVLMERREQRLTLQPISINTAPAPEEEVEISVELGKASYYADKFNGRTTASGSVFSNAELTAAHRTLDFGTQVRVVDPNSGNSVVVTITDRGPYVTGRVIDLSSAAFAALAPLSRGVIDVRLEILE